MDVKTTGEQRKFFTGSVRDSANGKPRIDLIPESTLVKLGIHYGNGSSHYGDRNWEKGQLITQYMASFERHYSYFKNGITDENHLIAAIWNLIAIDYTLDAIKTGLLPAELDDRPVHMKDGNPIGKMIKNTIDKNIESCKDGDSVKNNNDKEKDDNFVDFFKKMADCLKDERKIIVEKRSVSCCGYDSSKAFPFVTLGNNMFVTLLTSNGKLTNYAENGKVFYSKDECDFFDLNDKNAYEIFRKEVERMRNIKRPFAIISEPIFEMFQDNGGELFGYSSKDNRVKQIFRVKNIEDATKAMRLNNKNFDSFFIGE